MRATIREAVSADAPAIMAVRLAVRENVLTSVATVTVPATAEYLTEIGRGWVAESGGEIVGFSIANRSGLIWALFLRPEWEGLGLGRRLLDACVAWLRGIGVATAFLETGPGMRAEGFYRREGWRETGRDRENVAFCLDL